MTYEEDSLEGNVLSQILAIEFWYEGKLESPCNSVYIMDMEDKCWHLYYDDEYYCWAFEFTKKPFPKVNTAEGFDSFYYPVKEMIGSKTILQKEIIKFDTYYSKDLTLGDLIFKRGGILRLTYNNVTEISQYMIFP